MATHCSIPAHKIPWTEEPGRLQSIGHKESDTSERARVRARTHTHTHTHTHSLSNHITIYLFVPLTDIGVVSKILLLQTILQKISLYLNRSIDLSIYTYLLRANYNFQTSFFQFFIKQIPQITTAEYMYKYCTPSPKVKSSGNVDCPRPSPTLDTINLKYF